MLDITRDLAGQGFATSPDTHPNHTEPAGKREVDLYIRTYETLLRSSGPIAVDTLASAHLNSQSSLHAGRGRSRSRT